MKVKEPQSVERKKLREGQILYTYLHLAPDADQTKELLDSGVTAIAYETVTGPGGTLPLLKPMSQVAGRMSIQAGASALEKAHGGRGVLLGGVPGVMPGKVAVIGGGLSGVELAGVVAERLKGKATVTLFASEAGIMPGSPPGQRDAARKTLDAAGVATRVGARATAVNEPSDSYAGGVSAAASVTYTEADGEPTTEDYDVVCWAVGQRVESPESWPFPRDEGTNKIASEKTLRVTGHARVFAVGDVARLSDDSSSDARTGNDAYVASPPPARFDVLPATAQVAFQQADYAAWNVWSSLSSRPLLPFKYQHIGDMMVLGKTDAAVALPVGDATLDGPVAALLRRAAYLYRMPTNEHRAKLATSWLEQGAEFAAKEGPGILKSLGVPVPDFLAPNQGPNSRT